MEKVKISKTTVDKLPLAEPGKRYDVFDKELKGFGIRIGADSKTYIVLKRVKGKLTRISIGRHGVITADKAREKAIKTLGDLADGKDINREKAKERERGVTLADVFDQYKLARKLRAGTLVQYQSLLDCHLGDWKGKPLADISREMIAKKHLKIAEGSGEVPANNAMRLFRQVYNYARSVADGAMPENPVKRLSDSRQWFKVGRRQTSIKEHELATWYQAVMRLDNPKVRDYLLLLLFTGMRKQEGLKLRWSDVDMEGKAFTIPGDVAKNTEALTLPMSSVLYGIFKARLELRENEFVFPGKIDLKGVKVQVHLKEPKRQVVATIRETMKIVNGIETDEELDLQIEENPGKLKPGINFCLHDLRRTFASIAENVVSYGELKRLLNHSHGGDVTAGYLVIPIEKLRAPMQRVTDTILAACERKEAGKVLPFHRPAVAE